MKFNGIDFDKMTNTELIELCLKYKLIDRSKQYNRQDLLNLIKSFIIDRLNRKKQNSTNIKSFSIDSDKEYKRRKSKGRDGVVKRMERNAGILANQN